MVVYEVNPFALSKYDINEKEFISLMNEIFSKEGYDEREIESINDLFGTTSLFNKYNPKSHSFTDTSRKHSRSVRRSNTSSSNNSNRTSITRSDSKNREKISKELEYSFF